MNLKQIIQLYTSIEALSYLTNMLFGAAMGCGLSAILLTYTTNSFEIMKLLLILTFILIFIGTLFRMITLICYKKIFNFKSCFLFIKNGAFKIR